MNKFLIIFAIVSVFCSINTKAQENELPYRKNPIRFYVGISMGEDHDRYELHKNNGNTLFLDDFRNRTELPIPEKEVEKHESNGVTKNRYTSLHKVDIYLYETDYNGNLTKKSDVIYSSYAYFSYFNETKDDIRKMQYDDYDFDFITISDRNKKWYWKNERVTYAKKFNRDRYIFMILPNFIYDSDNDSYYSYQIYVVLIQNDEGKYIANTFYPKNKHNKDFNTIDNIKFKKINNETRISCSFNNNDNDLIFEINDNNVNYIGDQKLKKFNE